jgi:hypothetical protein
MRAYKLYTNTTGSNNGVASLKITKKARIRAIQFDLALLGGAGVGRMNIEVSKQNTVSLTTNDTPETVLSSASIAINNAVPSAENVLVMCDLGMEVGDTIYLNSTFTGAVAPASTTFNVYLYV